MAVSSNPQPATIPSDWTAAREMLVRSLEEARYFQGSLVLVYGPAGVGKSRLINAALSDAHVSDRRIRRTFVESRDTENPFKAVLSLARWAAKLEEVAPELDAGGLVLGPFRRTLASTAGEGSRGPLGEPEGSVADTEYRRLVADLEFYKREVEAWGERSRFLHELAWMILDAAARRHVMWIVESAQHLDPHSLAVIRYLSSCLTENPLVIWLNIDTADDGALPPSLAGLATGPRARSVVVPRLSRTGLLEILGGKYPGQSFSDRQVDAILKESQGLVVTAEQLANDPRVLRPTGGEAPLTATNAVDVMARKLEALAPASRELVERLAVVGEECSLPLAARLSGSTEEGVRPSLVALVDEGFLLELEPGLFSFRLTALPAEIEARIPENRRRPLHRAAAEAFESSPSGLEDQIFEVAEHWRKAEAWDSAARACLTAARFSSDSFAPEGGLLYAQRALDSARHLPDGRAGLEAAALIEKGRALYDLGRLHDALEPLQEALTLITREPSLETFRAWAQFYLARALTSLARPQEAFEFVKEASAALEKVHDARARLMLHQVIGVAFMLTDQNREAVEHFREMLVLADGLGDQRERSYAQKNLSAVLLALNPRDPEGWALVNAALEHHTRTNNYAGLAAGYLNRSLTKLELKDSDGALSDLAQSRQAAELAHAPLLIASAGLQEATVLVDRSEFDRAEELLQSLAPWMSAMEQPGARVSFALLRARVAEAQQRPDEADRLYEEATCIAEPGGESPALWECRLRRAALAKRVGALERFRRLRSNLPGLEEVGRVAPALVALREEVETPVP